MAEALKTFREALLNEKIFQVGAVKIFATNHYISAVMEADSSSIHLRATPENCSLVNRGPAGSNGRAVLHFGQNGFTGVPADVANALLEYGVSDNREPRDD